jgi:hypothetical protein
MMRAPLKFASVAAAIIAVLVAAACSARGGILGVPGAENVDPGFRASAVPTSIPLIPNSGDKFGFHVQLSIAGTQAKSFLFDTGSGGLWVYANAIKHPKKPVRDLGIKVENTYSSGLHYEGKVVETTIDFGNGLSAKSLPLVRVNKAYCVNKHCTKVYGTGDVIRRLEEKRGLWGTLGADVQPKRVSKGAQKSDLYNALFALGSAWTSFAVTPTAIEASPSMTGFTTIAMVPGPKPNAPLPNGAKSWMRDVPVCYTIARSSTIYTSCMSTLFDTGAELGVTFQTNATTIPTRETTCGSILAPGNWFSASRSGDHGKLLTEFKTGRRQNWNEVRVTTPAPSATPQVNTGVTFYNRNEILFDAVHGLVGLMPLDPPVHNFESHCD